MSQPVNVETGPGHRCGSTQKFSEMTRVVAEGYRGRDNSISRLQAFGQIATHSPYPQAFDPLGPPNFAAICGRRTYLAVPLDFEMAAQRRIIPEHSITCGFPVFFGTDHPRLRSQFLTRLQDLEFPRQIFHINILLRDAVAANINNIIPADSPLQQQAAAGRRLLPIRL